MHVGVNKLKIAPLGARATSQCFLSVFAMPAIAKAVRLTFCFALTICMFGNLAYGARPSADSSTLGIHGGDGRTRGIHGGDGRTRGIHGGDGRVLGIHGGDGRTRGIHGGDGRTRGIHGGDGRTLESSTEENQVAAPSTTSQTTSTVTPLFANVAMGPVEAIVTDSTTPGIVVLGRFFATDPIDYSVGDYVLAASSDDAGTLSAISQVNEDYVAGVSPVILRAPVSAVSEATARMTVGTVEVDYAALLSESPDLQIHVGSTVEVQGTQPVLNGVIIL